MNAVIKNCTAVWVLTVLMGIATGSEALASTGNGAGASDRMTLHLEYGDFELVPCLGALRIEIDGFRSMQDSGKPMLPVRTSLFLLPPGARAVSLSWKNGAERELAETYAIAPSPPLLPLPDSPNSSRLLKESQAEWERARASVYSRDDRYPEQAVWIAGAGSLRKYSYVAVSYAPFRYHPLSGLLVQHEFVEVEIEYRLPVSGSAEEAWLAELMRDRAADAEAARLFENFHELEPLYGAMSEESGDRDESHDYVIITSSGCESVILASDFLDWKASLGYDPRIVQVTDPEIAGQPGIDLAERIRNFLRESLGPWGIRYVLLVGDHPTIPMRYCFPDPTNHQHNPGSPGNPGGSVPTDCYYADLSLSDAESWDLDGDGYHGEYAHDMPDFLADVSVGRIPSSVPSKVTYALDKIVRYEQDTGDWKDRALHGGAILFHENQDGMDIPFRDGAVCLDLIETASMAGWLINHYCEHDGLVPSGYDWPALTQSVFTSAWRWGRWGVVNWAGHGSPDGAWRLIWTWDDGDGIFETDGSDGYSWEAFVADWVELEDDYPSIVWAVSCSVGYPEDNPSGNLGIDLLTRPGFGAAAGIVSATRSASVTAYWPDDPGGTETLCCEFNRFLIDGPEGPEKVGDAHFDSKFYCFVNYGWQSYREYKNQYVFNVFGDPAMSREGVVLTSAEDESTAASAPGLVLLPNQPNPFNPETRIRFRLPLAGVVEVAVYSVGGRRVSTLYKGELDAGWQDLSWNGCDDSGEALPSGIYLCRVASASGTSTRKMTLLK